MIGHATSRIAGWSARSGGATAYGQVSQSPHQGAEGRVAARSGFVGGLCAVLGERPRTIGHTGWQDRRDAIPLPRLTTVIAAKRLSIRLDRWRI